MKTLNVFYETELVGALSEDNEERLNFKYSKEWPENSNSFSLSIALKLTEEQYGHLPTKAFFENLLPEGSVKESLEAHSKTNIRGEFEFLKIYGEDCAGAFVTACLALKISNYRESGLIARFPIYKLKS